MKKIPILFIGLLAFLALLCIMSTASALSIDNLKIGGQELKDNFFGGSYYAANYIIDRAPFEENPTIEFDIDFFDEENAVIWPLVDVETLNMYANIFVGSPYLLNDKDIWMGYETGNFETVQTKSIEVYDIGYAPIEKTRYERNQRYIASIPLNIDQSHYTYTLQNPDVLCFDAHVYEVSVYISAYTDATEGYLDISDGPAWDYETGDYADDTAESVYDIKQKLQKVKQTQDMTVEEVAVKIYRVGTLPAGFILQCGVRLTPDGPDLGYSFYNSATLNAGLTTDTDGQWVTFYLNDGVPMEAGDIFYISLTAHGGDSSHNIMWRGDTNAWPFNKPHYNDGWLGPWYDSYYRGYSGGSWGSWETGTVVYSFRTSGCETESSTIIGGLRYYDSEDATFIFDTYGPTIDRSAGFTEELGWSGSQYVAWKQNVGTTYNIFLGNADPAHMDQQTSDIIGKGMTFDTAGVECPRYGESDASYVDTKIPLTVVLVDKDRQILDYDIVDSYLPVLETYDFEPYGPSPLIADISTFSEFRLLQYTVGEDQLEARTPYYVYVGVPIGNETPYNYSTTYISTDDTVKKVNFSIDSLKVGGSLSQDHDKSHTFMGAYVFFETQIDYVDTATAGAFRTTPSWVTNFVIWCSNSPPSGLGVPWLPVLLGFIPAIILMGAIYAFMRQYQISAPQYVYAMAGIGGLASTWMIGLLSLWIFVLMSATLAFIAMYQFREPISQALTTVSEVRQAGAFAGMTKREAAREALPTRGRTKRLLTGAKTSDMGVIPSSRPIPLHSDWNAEVLEWEEGRALKAVSKNGKKGVLAVDLKRPGIFHSTKKNNPKRIPRRDNRLGGHGEVPHPGSYTNRYMKTMEKRGYHIEGDYWVRNKKSWRKK